jgi:ATP-dependent Clp endopeptidase proteolytic subunit ClpP
MKTIISVDPRLKPKKIDDLIDEPKIIRVSEFDEEAVADFEEEIAEAHLTGQTVIPVVIDSFGGGVYALMSMMAAIDASSIPVATIVTGKAMSAGAMLFCYGAEGYRFMDPNAILMIHDMSSGYDGKVEELKVHTTHVDALNKKMYKRIATHLGHDENFLLDTIKGRSHTDWFLTAKEAKRFNMANHLRQPEFKVTVSLNMEFE